MPINPYDDALEQLDETAGPKVQGTGPRNPYEETITLQDEARTRDLRRTIVQAPTTSPDRAAEVLTLSQRTGIPTAIIERNFDTIQKRARLVDTPYAQMLRDTPALTTWLQEQPAHAAVAQDDLEPLGFLEWLVTAPQRAFARGRAQVEYGQLRAKSITGELSADEQTRMAAAKAAMEVGGQLGTRDRWFRGAITGTAEQLPMLFGALLAGAQRGVPFGVAAGTAAAAAGQLGPQIAVPEELVTVPAAFVGGLSAGMLTGGAEFTRALESGLAYDEYLDFKDELGRTLDPDVAKAAALATGVMNAGLEVIGLEFLFKSIPGLDKLTGLFTRGAVKQALRVPTVRAALAEAVKSYGQTLTAETSIEIAQRAVTVLSGEIAKQAEGLPARTPADVAQDLTEEAAGALQAFALMLAPGPGLQVVRDSVRARQAAANVQFFAALGEGIQQSKTAQRLPAAAQALIDRATADGPINHLYAPVDTWTQYWQSQGVDPAAMATEITGSAAAYEHALRSGEDLEIPIGRYATKLAGTDHNAFFAREVRLKPDEMNAREAEAFQAQEREAVTSSQTTEVTPSPADQVRQLVTEQLVNAGVEAGTAESYAGLYEQAFQSLAERAGIDPLELYRQYGLTVTRPDLEPLQPGGARRRLPDSAEAQAGGTPPAPGGGSELSGRAEERRAPGAGRQGPDGGPRPGAAEGRAVRVPAAYEPRLAVLRDDARRHGFAGSDDSLTAAFAARLTEAQQIARDLAPSDDERDDSRALLQTIARAGGLGIEAESAAGMRGELEHMLESLSRHTGVIRRGARSGQKLPKAFRRSGGLPDLPGIIVRKGGLPADRVFEHIREDPRWAERFDSLSDFLAAVDEAIGIETGRIAAPAKGSFSVDSILESLLDVRPGGHWWQEGPSTLEAVSPEDATVNASGESAASLEAIRRQEAMQARGEHFVVYDRTGARRLLIGPDAIDYVVQPGESFGVDGPEGFRVLDDRGGKPPAPNLADLLNPDHLLELEPGADAGSITFDITEFEQGLFDDPATPVDRLTTGELQPRLPGAETVRDQEVVQPPIAELREDFTLTPPEETQPSQTTLFQSAPLTHEDVGRWVHEMKARTGPDLAALDVWLTPAGDLKLAMLAIDRGAQRAGLGTAVMRALTAFADAHGKRLTLSPAQRDDAWGTTSRSRLVKFYKRFGFVENRGRRQDFSISESMYREPTLRATATGLALSGNKTATPEFRAWFGASKVVDAHGQPLVVHHGTARGDRVGNVFKKSRATSGPMAFFTSDQAIAEKYSKQKQDTSFEMPESYAGWFRFKPAGARSEVNLDSAWWHLTPAERQMVLDRLPRVGYQDHESAMGPIVDGSESIASEDHIEYLLREARGNGLRAARDLWLDSGALFNDEAKFLDVLTGLGLAGRFRFDDPHVEVPKVFSVYLAIQRPLDTSEISEDEIAALEKAARRQRKQPGQVGADLWDKALRNPIEWVEQLKADRATDTNSFVWSSIPDWVTTTLKTFGYDGIRDRGGKTGGTEHDVWIPFEPTQIKSVENVGTFDPTKRSILKQGRRGAIRFGADRQFNISLLEHADLSTFLHETGHFYLEVFGDLADQVAVLSEDIQTGQQAQLLQDYQTLLQWFGVTSRDQITTEHHERFASGFEAYLMEGRAPSVALRSTFARFRAWLLGIYRSMQGIGVQLPEDVRRVMDRMLATDAAIFHAEQQGRIEPLFATAADAGMSEAEFRLYRDTVAEASRTAREQLDRQLMDEVLREQRAEWKAAKARIEGDVTADVHSRPAYQALAAIQRGTKPDGAPLLEGMEPEPVKLSRQLIVERYGEARLKRLPHSFVYVRDGGADPDVVASVFGFATGDDLLTALEQAGPMKAVIEHETNRRLHAEFGSLLLDGSLLERAKAAVANDQREQVIRAELRALWKKEREVRPFVEAGERAVAAERKEREYERRWFEAEAKLRLAIERGESQAQIAALRAQVQQLHQQARRGAATIAAALPPDSLLRETARERIGGTRVRDLRPATFWAASRKASAQATAAAARQDFGAAIAAKQQELLNVALFRAATDAQQDVAARVKRVQSLTTTAARQRLGRAGESYLDQVDAILDRYSFARVSQKALERRASLQKWIAALEAEGLPIDLPDEVLDEARRTPYQQLTVDELVGVTDGIDQIAHLARLKNRLLKAHETRELEAVVADVTSSIEQHARRRPRTRDRDRRPAVERRRWLDGFIASHRKVASLARELDGFEDGGVVWEYVIRPLNEAGDREAVMKSEAVTALRAIFDEAYPGLERRRLYEKQHIRAVNQSLSTMERLMVALNWGNDGNRERIRTAEKWTDHQVHAVLDTLDRRDWQFVQSVWKYIDSFWPEIEAKQKRVYGVAPAKVAPVTIQTRYGEMPGGYFPLKYDDRLTAGAAAHLDLEAGIAQKQAAYVKATTRRGHTKERLERVNMPVRLDFGVIFEHVNQVVHDLSHHETLIDVGRILGDRQVQRTIYDTYGDLVYRQFKDAIRDIAFGDTPTTGFFEKGLAHVRSGATIAALAWNLSTSLIQLPGLTQSIVRVGPKWVARGLMRFARDAASMESSYAWISDKSDFMRLRGKTMNRELHEIRQSLGVYSGRFVPWVDAAVKAGSLGLVTRQSIADSYFFLLERFQRVVDVPTWLGAYEKALAHGDGELRAIALADQAVLDSQMGGQIKDLAAVQRGSQALKLWTTLYGFFSTTHNLMAESFRRTSFRSPWQVGRLMADYMLLLVIPAALGYALRRALRGGDDDESWLEGLAREQLAYLMGTIAGVRELSGAVEGFTGYEGPAGARGFAALSRLVGDVGQILSQGEVTEAMEKKFLRDLNDSAGVLFHYPAVQVRRSVEGVAAFAEGQRRRPPAGPQSILFGPPPEKR